MDPRGREALRGRLTPVSRAVARLTGDAMELIERDEQVFS
jgi:hypothetical protein